MSKDPAGKNRRRGAIREPALRASRRQSRSEPSARLCRGAALSAGLPQATARRAACVPLRLLRPTLRPASNPGLFGCRPARRRRQSTSNAPNSVLPHERKSAPIRLPLKARGLCGNRAARGPGVRKIFRGGAGGENSAACNRCAARREVSNPARRKDTGPVFFRNRSQRQALLPGNRPQSSIRWHGECHAGGQAGPDRHSCASRDRHRPARREPVPSRQEHRSQRRRSVSTAGTVPRSI